jgi:hypothetical protein
LESALEANADLFITADQALINRLRHALQLHPENFIIEMANKICGTPFQTLIRLETTNNAENKKTRTAGARN